MDRLIGGKWLIHVSKHRKNNLNNPAEYLIWEFKHDTREYQS